MNVTITCPVCEQELEADVTIINDCEGDADVPNGLHYFQSLDDYTIDWQAHHADVMALDDDDGPNIKYMRLCNHTCEQLVMNPETTTITVPDYDGKGERVYLRETHPIQDKLIYRLTEAGIDAEANREPPEVDDMSMSNFDD